MGTLILQLGQAGNQIGLQVMDYVDQTSQLYEESYLKRNDQNILHSIMVDTEPKILKPILENRKRYPFIDIKNVLYFQHGRGNNWALGYMDSVIQAKKKEKKDRMKPLQFNKFMEKPSQLLDLPGFMNKNFQTAQSKEDDIPISQYLKENEQILEDVINMIRKEIEKIDYFIGINMIYSLGGGTGSGLGSRLLEEFRDVFSDISLFSTVVFPSRDGETTLQHYNCILSLAHLQTYSDLVIYYENDKINDYLNYSRSKSIEKVVDITNINQYIASNIMNLTRLNDYSSFNRFYFDLLLDTAPMDDFKFVEVYSTPYFYDKTLSTGNEASWEKLTEVMCQQVNVQKSYMTEKTKFEDEKTDTDDMKEKLLDNQKQKKNVSLAVNTIFRYGEVEKSLQRQDKILANIEKKLISTFNPVKWNSDCLQYEFINERLKQGVDNKMMLSIANRSSIASSIQEINNVAYNKFKANAFMHWYYKFGIEKSDFENAFLIMDNIVENYNSIK